MLTLDIQGWCGPPLRKCDISQQKTNNPIPNVVFAPNSTRCKNIKSRTYATKKCSDVFEKTSCVGSLPSLAIMGETNMKALCTLSNSIRTNTSGTCGNYGGHPGLQEEPPCRNAMHFLDNNGTDIKQWENMNEPKYYACANVILGSDCNTLRSSGHDNVP